jgi:tRNA A58 N-methylase Trm61
MSAHLSSWRTAFLLSITLFVPATASAQGSGSTIGPTVIFDAIGVREGGTVCEIGAGDGDLTLAAARIVGPQGRVYSTELGDSRVKALRDKVAGSNLSQVTVVAGDARTTNLPDGACDALFMRNVYHHFTEPAEMNASIAMALKPGGRLAIVDFSPPGDEAKCPADRGKDGMHGITAESLAREIKDAGFEPIASETGAQRWFMVVVSKPRG